MVWTRTLSHLRTRLALRFLRSRAGSMWFSGLHQHEREELLLATWRSCNAGLDWRQKYELLGAAYDDRRMRNYSLASSAHIARIYGLFDVVSSIRRVGGEIVECGVGRGVSLAVLAYAVAFFELDKAVYGFDSFAGFPPASVEDVGSRVETSGQTPSGWFDTSPELVVAALERDRQQPESLLTRSNVQVAIVPGFFAETLADKLPHAIALLHVDCDLYESTRTVLEACLPRVAPGGVVLLDEYGEERWPGATTAVDEICKGTGLLPQWLHSAQRYIIQVPEAGC